MTSDELGLISDHMGHSVNINTSVYKLQQNTIERSKVARILLAADRGVLHKMAMSTDSDQIAVDDIELCYGEQTFRDFIIGIQPP